MFYSIFIALIAASLVSNLLIQGVGFESLTNNENRLKPTLIKTGVISVIALIIFNLNYVLMEFVLKPINFEYLSLLVIVFLLIGLNELYIYINNRFKLNLPSDYSVVLNSVVVIIGLLSFNNLGYGLALVNATGLLVGFILFSLLFTMLINRLNIAPIIKSFKGLPILLIILGIIALMLNGLGGVF